MAAFKKKFSGKKRDKFDKWKVKYCRFCSDKKMLVDFKEPRMFSSYITERGKIIPRRVTGLCARHQREVTTAVKRARVLAFLPYTSIHMVSGV